MNIAITTSSFGQYDSRAFNLLRRKKIKVFINKMGKTLNQKETLNIVQGCGGVIAGTEKYSREILKKLPDLRIISRCGAGDDNIDLEASQEFGIKVYTTPVGPTRAVAELVIGLMLSLLRHIPLMDRQLRAGQWQKKMGCLLMDKKIGIVGFGRIGREVGRLSALLGARIYYHDPFLNNKPGFSFASPVEFKTLLKDSDILSLHLPLNEENKHSIGAKELAMMKPNAFLINCSRGGIVDESILYAFLRKNKLAGAALDVFGCEPYYGPLCQLDNVILTPHVGSYAQEARIQMEFEAVQNLLRGLNNQR